MSFDKPGPEDGFERDAQEKIARWEQETRHDGLYSRVRKGKEMGVPRDTLRNLVFAGLEERVRSRDFAFWFNFVDGIKRLGDIFTPEDEDRVEAERQSIQEVRYASVFEAKNYHHAHSLAVEYWGAESAQARRAADMERQEEAALRKSARGRADEEEDDEVERIRLRNDATLKDLFDALEEAGEEGKDNFVLEWVKQFGTIVDGGKLLEQEQSSEKVIEFLQRHGISIDDFKLATGIEFVKKTPKRPRRR